jgi:tetraacyldisaccharide-1-P 4'-kinase
MTRAPIALGWARRIAASFEDGTLSRSRAARVISAAAGEIGARSLARRPYVPPGTVVIGVGGATLGGSWKTPLVIAIGEALSLRGMAVGIASHAYRASSGGPRRIYPGDEAEEVGDEALLAARALAPHGIPVVGSSFRREGLDLLAGVADVIVADDYLRARAAGYVPVLSLDGDRPYGSGKCVPAGDLRAPREVLSRAADETIEIVDPARGGRGAAELVLDIPELGDRRFALVTAIARPSRVVAALAARGKIPVAHLTVADHGDPSSVAALERAVARAGVSVVLTTEKCALSLPAELGGVPVVPVRAHLRLSSGLVDRLERRARDALSR